MRGAGKVFQHDHEFVAAEPCQRIALAQAGSQAPGKLLQEQVADGMTQRVVQGFEIVDVDEQQSPHL